MTSLVLASPLRFLIPDVNSKTVRRPSPSSRISHVDLRNSGDRSRSIRREPGRNRDKLMVNYHNPKIRSSNKLYKILDI